MQIERHNAKRSTQVSGATAVDIPFEELPLWMRRARQRIDWGLLFVVALSLMLASSFRLQEGIDNASLNYAFRAADTAESLREGRLYPRWSPHALGGYGAPIAHYYPPGAPYAVALIEVLFTSDTLTAMHLAYITSLVLAGAAVYALVARWMNAGSGMLAALLYVFSPYVGFVAPHVLGDLPGVLVIALIPSLLWAVNRLLILNSATDFSLVTLITAALLFTAPNGWIIGCVLAGLLCITHAITASSKLRIFAVVAAAALGSVLASIYWLPALIEADAVRWVFPDIQPPRHSLDISTLFAPLPPIDPAELAYSPQLTLGWIMRVFILLGIAGIILQRAKGLLYPALFFCTGIALLTWTTTFMPGETWMLGTISLCFSITGSAALSIGKNLPVRLSRLLLPVMMAVILAGSINVWLVPQRTPMNTQIDPVGQIRYEQQGLGIAVLPPGAPIPTTISSALESNRSLLNSYQFTSTSAEGSSRCRLCPLEKIAPTQILRNGQINVITQDTHGAQYQIRTLGNCAEGLNCRLEQPIIMNWQTSFFPGWQAWLDDLPLMAQRNPQTGLIDIRLPRTSERELSITLGSTPIREIGWIVSGLAALLTIVVAWQRLREAEEPDLDFSGLPLEQTRFVFVVVLTFGLMFALSTSPGSPLQLSARPNSGLADITLMNVQTEVGLQLFGYQLNQMRVRPGSTVDLTLYWRALRLMPENYRVRLYLRDVNRSTDWLAQPVRDPGGFPTRRWTTNGYIKDVYRLDLPDEMFPGNYQFAVEGYTCNTLDECNADTRLTFFNPLDQTPEKTLRLPFVLTISRP